MPLAWRHAMHTLMGGRTVPMWIVPLGLFGVALIARWLAGRLIDSAPTEGSAYYVAVAANLVSGRGLVSDAVWSYATPPLIVPKPAFELWLPMATFVSALPMAVLGTTLAAAQLGSSLLGALVAPLTWLVGRDAAVAHGLDRRRRAGVAVGSGLLAAVAGPFVIATVGPDSATPFLVFGVLAAWLMPRATDPTGSGTRRWVPGLLLGLALGLAYLSRQEAIWLGLAFLVMFTARARSAAAVGRLRAAGSTLAPVVVGGLIIVTPWLVRDAMVFGTPFPGQALENALLRRNEDIFAYLHRPALADFLAQGPAVIVGNQLAAAWHDLVEVLLVPAFPIGVCGLLALVALRRSPAVARSTALGALLLSGGVTFAVTVAVFPVATLWGTFGHAAGPLLVGLAVCAVLAADGLMAQVSLRRSWERPNIIIAPIALLAVAVPLAGLQALTLGRQSARQDDRVRAVAGDLVARNGSGVVISDHPMWLTDALGGSVVALPDEPPAAVARLAADFGATWLVVFDQRGRYPDALLGQPRDACLAADPEPIGPPAAPAWLFRLDTGCLPS